MQRAPTVVRVSASVCPMRVASNTALKNMYPRKYRDAQAVQNAKRAELESGPIDLHKLQLTYPPVTTPEFVLKNGWCPPPEELPNLPFKVARTGKGKFIPVYRDMKNGHTRVVTIVRKASGDLRAFTSDLSKVCQDGKVEVKGGTLQVTGDHVTNVKRWLSGLGF